MDKILTGLQGKSFHLSDNIFTFLEGQYITLISIPIPDLLIDTFHPGTIRQIISYHREQLRSDEYLQHRLDNPTSGTIDHLHAEITASTAVNIGTISGYRGYTLELLRAAGHLHDSDRSFPGTMITGEEKVRHDPEAYGEYKLKHAVSSSERAADLTKKAEEDGYYTPTGFINDLSYLILRHELGGEKKGGINLSKPSEVQPELNLNDLTDIVTDSDSLSYFYANILTNWEESNRNILALSNKVHFMYDRMSESGRKELLDSVLSSNTHILGINAPKEPDIQSIKSILLDICK